MRAVIGIDLGTANSCVAWIVDGKALIIPDKNPPQGSSGRTTPSVVSIDTAKNIYVGHSAIKKQELNRKNTIYAVKRLIGLKYDSEEVSIAKKKLAYEVVPANNNDAWVLFDDVPTSPEEISAHILQKMKKIAEDHIGESVHRAVITVPAHFNDSQRQATRDAGQIAGLDVMRIINEPTAAALAYGMDLSYEHSDNDPNQERLIAVFDLGGGTFDISILAMKEGVFEVISTHGDTYLGGEDFDQEILSYLMEKAERLLGVNLQNDKLSIQRLKIAAKQVKHDLSNMKETTVNLTNLGGLDTFSTTLNRKDLERIVSPILKRLEKPCLQALEDAELIPDDITDVVLVGGMTKMPAVRSHCRNIFKKVAHQSVDPDEAVALGAALQAALLDGLIKGIEFMDVLSLSLGIEAGGGRVENMIKRNTRIPTQVSKIFTTTSPNQSQVSIHVVQGESRFSSDNESMGRFELGGIPRAPRGEPEICITFAVDNSGIISVLAKDLDTGEKKQIEIIASSGLDDQSVKRLIKENYHKKTQQQKLSDLKNREQKHHDEGPETSTTPIEVKQKKLKELIFSLQFKLDSEGENYPKSKSLGAIIEKSRITLARSDEIKQLEKTIKELQKEADFFEKFLLDKW